MRRPLSSSEVPWLVRLLLHLSDAFNAYFQLDQGQSEEAGNTAGNTAASFFSLNADP